MKRKRIGITALLAALCIWMSMPAYAAIYTVADFSDYSAAREYGMPVSTEQSYSGGFSLKWSGHDMYRNIVCPLDVRDYSGGAFKMWIYAADATKSDFRFAVIADNPETPEIDCYVADFWNYWIGWKEIALSTADDFAVFGQPLGWDKADALVLCSVFGSNVPKPQTLLYLDGVKFEK